MIPELPEGVSDLNQLDFFDKLVGNLTDQATVHIHWWTHRQNPSVCWICDVITIMAKLTELADKNLTKSTVRHGDCSSQEEDSDSEIENVISNQPEYEVDEDGYQDKQEPE